MNAQAALELAKNNWSNNEQKLMSYVIGFQQKVEDAAKAGRTQCPINAVPNEAVDFVSYYFEQLGYFVFVQPVGPNDALIIINWKCVPNMSRGYLETAEMEKFLNLT